MRFNGTLVPPKLATAPSSPTAGQMWYDTTANILKWWDGDEWIAAQGGEAAGLSASDLGVTSIRDYGAVGDNTADDTAAITSAITAAPAGGTLIVPAGYTFKCTSTITIGKALRVEGGGTLSWASGITNATAIRVTAQNVHISGITMINAGQSTTKSAQTGDHNTAIKFEAHNGSVLFCTLEKFQDGVMVASTGEFTNHKICFNRIKDIVGAGDGPSDLTSTYGEDRGDGIVTWGAKATVIGNVINCMSGSDARIGIHHEGLSPQELDQSDPHRESMVTISGNVVFGTFRRGIACEDVRLVSVVGNTVADATWWGIALSGGTGDSATRGCTVTGNTIKWTRLTAAKPGHFYSPRRCPIMLYGGVSSSSISGNNIFIEGDCDQGITLSGVSSTQRPTECTAANNTVHLFSGSMTDGILLDFSSADITVAGNIVSGFTNKGIFSYGSLRVKIEGNRITGAAGASTGIALEAETTPGGSVVGNTIRNVTLGMSIVNYVGYRLGDNTIDTATNGIDLWGCTNFVVGVNQFLSVTNSELNWSTGHTYIKTRQEYTDDFGDGSTLVFNIDHNLNSREVDVIVRETNSPYERVLVKTTTPTVNRVTLDFTGSTAPATNEFTVTVRR